MKFLRKFIKLPAHEKWLLAEAVGFLFLAKAMLLVLPFKLCLRTIKANRVNDKKADMDTLKQIRKAISRANKLALWKNVCLVQSFAGNWMLGRRNIKSKLMIGVSHNHGNNLIAHAWLVVDGYEIVRQAGAYVKLTEY